MQEIVDLWLAGSPANVVCTGDLVAQLDRELMSEIHRRGCHVVAELDETQSAPEGFDWITVKSPCLAWNWCAAGGRS